MDIATGAAPPPPSPPEVAGQRVDWTPRDVVQGSLAFIGAFLLIPIVPGLVLYAVYGDLEARGFLVGAAILNAFVYAAIVAVACYFTFGKYGGGLARLGVVAPRWSTLGWGLAGLAGALLAVLAWAGVTELIEPLRQGADDQVPRAIREDALLLTLTGILAIGLAPIAEETFFRGFLFTGIARWTNVAVAVVVSGLLFGAAHVLGNPLLWRTMPLFALIGIVFALTYLRSKNLVSVILAHTLFNTLGIIAIVISELDE